MQYFKYHTLITLLIDDIWTKNPAYGGTRRCSLSRHCATSSKVAGLIPNGVIILSAAVWPQGRLSL